MIRVISLALLTVAVSGCAMLNGGTPATDPGKSYGPCGSWVDCGPDQPKQDRCCPPTTACTVDDGGPYCAADSNYDPSDPATWGMKTRILRSPAPDGE